MTYLPDVNVLLALLFAHHEFHKRVESWISIERRREGLALATCPLTELGFLRVASGVAMFGVDLDAAKKLLFSFKSNKAIQTLFITDALDTKHLPSWVEKSGQLTDGYLKALSRKNRVLLATLDEGIPDAFLIPR